MTRRLFCRHGLPLCTIRSNRLPAVGDTIDCPDCDAGIGGRGVGSRTATHDTLIVANRRSQFGAPGGSPGPRGSLSGNVLEYLRCERCGPAGAAGRQTPASGGGERLGRRAAAEPNKIPSTRRGFTLGLIVVMAAVGALSLWAWQKASQAGHSAAIPAAATKNARPQRTLLHTPAQVRAAFLAFLPLGDHLDVEQALLHATGHPQGAATFPGRIGIQAQANGYRIQVTMPVDLAYLERTQEIVGGHLPGASDLKTGQLLVNGNDHVWAVDMDPRTRQATYLFVLGRHGHTLWALNWNARGIVSQNDSLN